ncbi:MAG: hypothetical protein IKC82_00165 [Lentisphaeria bacterium]|nr:hypothetical protein [Lentisphaeria bacterium]
MKKTVDWLLALLLFSLPVKFGGLAVMPEAGGFYPAHPIDWLYLPFPPHSLAFAGMLMLLLALFTVKKKEYSPRLWIFAGAWMIIPALAALPGGIRGESVILTGELSLLLGCGSVIAAAALILSDRPERAMFFAGAILAGGVFTALYGWHQHLVTLDETRRFVAEQEAAGIAVSEGMHLKLTDPRIYSTLASSNTLASLLMMMAILGGFCGSRWSKSVSPPRTSRIFFLLLNCAVWLPVLALTRSRSVILCLSAAGLLALFSHPKISWRWRIAGFAAGLVIIAGGVFYAVHYGRGVASMGERADYWRTCAILCREYPLTGAGWGEFFRTHMQIKVSAVDESARDPHNVVAAFASQCGIPSGLLMLAILIYPLVLLWKRRFQKSLAGAVFWCGVIFTIHSFIDCDWQVPALIAVMGVLYAIGIVENGEKPLSLPGAGFALAATVILGAAAAGVWQSYIYLAGDKALSRLQDKVHPPTRQIAADLAPFTVEYLAGEAAKYRPASAVIPMITGDWYYQCGDLAAAETAFYRALELDPVRPAAYMRLARIALHRGDALKAESFRQQAQKLFPRSRHYTVKSLYRQE